jgi:hypothetical protein
MLKHTGVRRTHIHNVRLAALLSLTAGAVNAEGFLGFSVLTTKKVYPAGSRLMPAAYCLPWVFKMLWYP